MAYIVGADRYQARMVTTSLDDLISKDNSVRVIDSYVESLNLENLGFIEYSGRNRGQSPYRRSDLLKLHIYGYLNKIRSSRALETEAKRNLELMWLINCITPDHGTIAGFVQKNKAAFHNTLRNLTLGYNYDTDRFESDSRKEDDIFLNLEMLCENKIETSDRSEGAINRNDRIKAMENMVHSLISDRLLELSKYVLLDPIGKRILIDKSSMQTDGYQVLIN